MINSHELFKLIKSLTKEEKRQFSLHIAYERYKGDAPAYVQLFEAMERLGTEEYDENAFRRKHQKAAWARSFHHNKQYLYEYLLRLLAPAYVQRNAVAQVHWHIMQYEMLLERNLLNLAKEHLDTAYGLAKRLDYRGVLPYLAARQLFHYAIYELKNDKTATRQHKWEELEQRFDAENSQTERFYDFYKKSLYLNFLSIGEQTSNILQQQENWQRLYAAVQTLPLTYPESKNTQTIYWQLLAFLKQIFKEVPDEPYMVWGVELILSDTFFADANPSMACSWLYNACIDLLQRSETEQADKLLARFKKFAENCPHKAIQRSENKLLLLSAQVYFWVKTQQWAQICQHCEAAGDMLNLDKTALPVGTVQPILFDWGQACFWLRDEKNMLKAWASFLQKEDYMYLWRKHAHLIYLLHLWQEGQWELLEYRFTQTYRMLRKEQSMGDFERTLFRFLRRSLRFPHKRAQALRAWQKALQDQTIYDARAYALDFFDYIACAEHLRRE